MHYTFGLKTVHQRTYPVMQFTEERYKPLDNLPLDDLCHIPAVQTELAKLHQITKGEIDPYIFAANDWCVIHVTPQTVTVTNSFNEFEPIEISLAEFTALFQNWLTFLQQHQSEIRL